MTDTRKEPRVPVAVRLSPAGVAALDEEAAREDRTRSNMGRILIAEAITARRKARR